MLRTRRWEAVQMVAVPLATDFYSMGLEESEDNKETIPRGESQELCSLPSVPSSLREGTRKSPDLWCLPL